MICSLHYRIWNEWKNEWNARKFFDIYFFDCDNEISSLEIPLQSVFISSWIQIVFFPHSNLLESVIYFYLSHYMLCFNYHYIYLYFFSTSPQSLFRISANCNPNRVWQWYFGLSYSSRDFFHSLKWFFTLSCTNKHL